MRRIAIIGVAIAALLAPAAPAAADVHPILTSGMQHAAVKKVQKALGVTPRSGYFGPLTLKAVKRYQRRLHARKKIRIPVFVHAHQSASPPLDSTLLDVSGGGASLQNPKGVFELDQMVELSFSPKGEKVRVIGQVVRVSRDGQVLHVEFRQLPDADKERIVRSVF